MLAVVAQANGTASVLTAVRVLDGIVSEEVASVLLVMTIHPCFPLEATGHRRLHRQVNAEAPTQEVQAVLMVAATHGNGRCDASRPTEQDVDACRVFIRSQSEVNDRLAMRCVAPVRAKM